MTCTDFALATICPSSPTISYSRRSSNARSVSSRATPRAVRRRGPAREVALRPGHDEGGACLLRAAHDVAPVLEPALLDIREIDGVFTCPIMSQSRKRTWSRWRKRKGLVIGIAVLESGRRQLPPHGPRFADMAQVYQGGPGQLTRPPEPWEQYAVPDRRGQIEEFTPTELLALAPYFTNTDRPGLRAHQPARDGEGRAVRALLAVARSRCGGCSSTSSSGRPRTMRRGCGRARVGGRARRQALRARVQRVRRRLGGAARRRAPRVRRRVEHPDQGARVGPADGVPRAVDALRALHRSAGRPLEVPRARRSSTRSPLCRAVSCARSTARSRSTRGWIPAMRGALPRPLSEGGRPTRTPSTAR